MTDGLFHAVLTEGAAVLRTRPGDASRLLPSGAIDPLAGGLPSRVDGLVPLGAQVIALGRGSCWVVDPVHNRIVETLPCPDLASFGAASADALAVQGRRGGLWYLDRNSGDVDRWDSPFGMALMLRDNGDVVVGGQEELRVMRPWAVLEDDAGAERATGSWSVSVEQTGRWAWAGPERRRIASAEEPTPSELPLEGTVSVRPSVVWGPEGWLATSDGGSHLWLSNEGTLHREATSRPVSALASGGGVLVVVEERRVVRYRWQGAELEELESWPDETISAAAVSTDGETVCLGTLTGSVRCRKDGVTRERGTVSGTVREVAVRADGVPVALAENGQLSGPAWVEQARPGSGIALSGDELFFQQPDGALVAKGDQGDGALRTLARRLPTLAALDVRGEWVVGVDPWGQVRHWARDTLAEDPVPLAAPAGAPGEVRAVLAPWVGLADGRLMSVTDGTWNQLGTVTRESAIEQLLEAPGGLLLVRTGASTVELWLPEQEQRLGVIAPGSALSDLRLDGGQLTLLHADGTTRAVDLDAFALDDCALASRWSADLPVRWQDGGVVRSDGNPPARCGKQPR